MINKMSRSFFFCLLLLPAIALAQEKQDLFTQVFGASLVETQLPITINSNSAGEILAQVQGDKLVGVNSRQFFSKLAFVLKPESLPKAEGGEWIAPEVAPFSIEYNPQSLSIALNVPTQILRASFKDMGNDPRLKFAGAHLEPAPFGAGLNISAERSFGDEELGGDSFSSYLDGFANYKGLVLSAQGRYQEDLDNKNGESGWSRGDINLTKDFIRIRSRAQVGDTSSGAFGYMNPRQIGGFNFRRQFSLDPYTKPFPQGQREITLLGRSRVKTFVNGSLIKDEILPAGNYKLGNLPLIDGLNFVVVEIENEFGQKRTVTFNLPTAINILRKDEIDYSVSYGKPYVDHGMERNYAQNSLASAYLQYGVSDVYSAGIFGQTQDDFSLSGMVNGLSTLWGNFFLEAAASKSDALYGYGQGLSWRFQKSSAQILSGFSTILRYDNYQKNFLRNPEALDSPLKESIEASLSFPLLTGVSIGAGFGVATYQDRTLSDREKFNLTANWRLNNRMNLNFYTSKISDGQGNESLAASAFFTWSLDDGLVTVFRDIENETSRLSYQSGNATQLYKPRLNASAEEGSAGEKGELAAQLPTPMADFYLRGVGARDNDGRGFSRASIRLASSALLAYDDGLAFALSRPSSSSFALFSPSKNLSGQKIALRSTSPYADTETPLFGDLALTNLVPYQYREVEVDPTFLNPGTSLERESFVLLPGYKSAHLIKIKDKGLRSVEGKILVNGKPLALAVGRFGSIGFFTNREGYFYVEGAPMGESVLEIQGEREIIHIRTQSRGVVDLGTIEFGVRP